MAATVTTNENFSAGTSQEVMDEAVRLRLKAGAITSEYSGSVEEGWILNSVWNVIGEQ